MSLRDDIQNELDAWALNPALNLRGPTAFFDAEFVSCSVATHDWQEFVVLVFARGFERVAVRYPTESSLRVTYDDFGSIRPSIYVGYEGGDHV